MQKQIRIKNISAIPVKWKLRDHESLSEEFSVQNTSGELKPLQETLVFVNFKALSQNKFSHVLHIDVQDNENMGLSQEPKPISIEAEAFDISVDIKFDKEQSYLDFGAIRVGELKEQSIFLKNMGLY